MVKKNLNTHLTGSIHRITIKKDKKSIDDIRFKKSGFKKCIQCGRCTASCPAAYMYPDYKPREMMRRFMFNDVHSDDFKSLIWNCGQCYSCRARCPRNCKAVLGVQAFQTKSVLEGDAQPKIMDISKKLKNNLYFHGETFLPSTQDINVLEEFGEKTYKHSKDNNSRRVKLGFKADDARRIPIPDESLQEIRKIMKLTGFMGDKN